MRPAVLLCLAVLAPAGEAAGLRRDWTGLVPAWEAKDLVQGDAAVNGSPSGVTVVGDTVVALGRGDGKDLVFAFAVADGKKLWQQEYPAPAEKTWKGLGNGPRAAPVIEGERVITLGAYGHLTCWALKTGERQWQVQVRDDSKTKVPYWGVCGTPAVFAGLVLVKPGGYEQGPKAPIVLAYRLEDGKPAWRSVEGSGSWAPLRVQRIDGKDQVLAWHGSGLKALDPADGKQLWDIPWKTAYDCHASLPAVEGAVLFLSSGYGAGCQAFELRAGRPEPLWERSKAVSACNADPVITGGHVYAFSGNGMKGSLKCLELRTGAEKWSSPDFGNGSLALVDGLLFCQGYGGVIGLVEAAPAACSKLAQLKVFEVKDPPAYAPPVVAGGRAFLRYMNRLVCFDLR